MYEGHYYAAERIRSLLVASVETETRFIGAERRRLFLGKCTKKRPGWSTNRGALRSFTSKEV